jgi:hypothetical protein
MPITAQFGLVAQIAFVTDFRSGATGLQRSGDEFPSPALILVSHHSKPVGRVLVCHFGRDLTAMNCVFQQCTYL